MQTGHKFARCESLNAAIFLAFATMLYTTRHLQGIRIKGHLAKSGKKIVY